MDSSSVTVKQQEGDTFLFLLAEVGAVPDQSLAYVGEARTPGFKKEPIVPHEGKVWVIRSLASVPVIEGPSKESFQLRRIYQ